METARRTVRIATWILLIASIFYNYKLKESNTKLMDTLESANEETEIVGMAMMKLKDQADDFEKERLALATAIMEPENFVVLDKGTAELTFKGFQGTLQWFTTHEQPLDPAIGASYHQLEGAGSPGVKVVDRGADGFRIAVPAGAKAYSLKGRSIDGGGHEVEAVIFEDP